MFVVAVCKKNKNRLLRNGIANNKICQQMPKRSIWDIKPLKMPESRQQGLTSDSSQPAALLLTMNSNPVNAMNQQFFTDLHETLDAVANLYPKHVPLLLSNDSKSKTFCAGLDLQYLQTIWHQDQSCKEFVQMINKGFARWYLTPNPTIAVINGHNIAGGTVLQLASDFRVMPLNDKYMTCLREMDLGLNLPAEVAEMMKQQLQGSNNLFYEMTMTAKVLTPTELKQHHLLTDYVEHVEGEAPETVHSKLVDKALAIACRIDYTVSGPAFAAMKRDYKSLANLNRENDDAFVKCLRDPLVQNRIVKVLESTKRNKKTNK